jgi:hypothetical protein
LRWSKRRGIVKMPYSVILTRKDRTVKANFKMYSAATPVRGDIIDVDADDAKVRARVTDITYTQPVDQVCATEV